MPIINKSVILEWKYSLKAQVPSSSLSLSYIFDHPCELFTSDEEKVSIRHLFISLIFLPLNSHDTQQQHTTRKQRKQACCRKRNRPRIDACFSTIKVCYTALTFYQKILFTPCRRIILCVQNFSFERIFLLIFFSLIHNIFNHTHTLFTLKENFYLFFTSSWDKEKRPIHSHTGIPSFTELENVSSPFHSYIHFPFNMSKRVTEAISSACGKCSQMKCEGILIYFYSFSFSLNICLWSLRKRIKMKASKEMFWFDWKWENFSFFLRQQKKRLKGFQSRKGDF